MVFTAVSPGQLVKANVTNANLRHAGRMGDNMIPIDTAGAGIDNTYDLGSLLYQWKDLYLTGKIYVNGVEFKGGGGGGGGLLNAENKSHLEKQGIFYPYSDPGICNESYTDSTNVVLTLRKAYVAAATEMIADINATSIDAMTTVWTSGTNTPTIATEATISLDGTSIKMSKTSLPAGNMTMYKTFTAFSLVDKQIAFSLYLDTLSNVTRAFITLESTAGNDKTWYIPVASLTAATWAHITVNPNTDTADASTGTFVPGSITKIYFGVTVSNSQTINSYWDIVNSVASFTIVDSGRKYLSRIWDATNSEWLYVNSVAGTGIHQRNIYTITALANSYAIASTYAKQRNVTIANNQGVFPSALSGAIAKTTYDIKEYWLPKSVSGQDIPLSWRFWDEEFKVSTLSSSTVTKVTSSTDKSGYFKNGDKVILYQKQYSGTKYQSRYNATVTTNFKLLTLTADATYGSSEITLTHTGGSNSGADTSYWYVVRYSVKMLALLQAMSGNSALSSVTPLTFSPKNISLPLINTDGFVLDMSYEISGAIAPKTLSYNNLQSTPFTVNGTLTQVIGGITPRNIAWKGFNQSNKLVAYNAAWNCYNASIANVKYSIVFYGKINDVYSYIFSNDDSFDGSHASTAIMLRKYSTSKEINFGETNNYAFWQSGTAIGAAVGDGKPHLWVFTFDGSQSSGSRVRGYVDGVFSAYTNLSPNDTWLHSGATGYINIGNDLSQNDTNMEMQYIEFYKGYVLSQAEISQIWNNGQVKRKGYDVGYYISSKITNQTGDKLLTTLEYSRQDTTNQNHIAYQFDGYVPGLTE